MGYGNVTERRLQPPQVGVSVVILALGPGADRVTGHGANHGANHGAHAAGNAADGHGAADGESDASRLWMPLVRRVRQPHLGDWALPGGDLRADRSLEQSAYLALESATDLHPKYLEQLHAFGDPDRSHGGLPMVSIVYWALVGRGETRGFAEADNVRWFPVDALPPLAFDHGAIVDHALRRLRERVAYPDIATKLVGPTFTLRQLHGVYEAVRGEAIDLANFRRRMLAGGQLEDTGDKLREGRQRPAAVYRYVPGAESDGLSGDRLERLAARSRACGATQSPLDALDIALSPLTTG